MNKYVLLLRGLTVASLISPTTQAQVLASGRHVASPGYGQHLTERSLSEVPDRLKAVSLKNALSELEQRYHVSFIYKSELVDAKIYPTADSHDATLEQRLESLLTANGLTYEKVRTDFYIILVKDQKHERTLRRLKRTGLLDETNPTAPLTPISTDQLIAGRMGRQGLLLNVSVQDRTVTGQVLDENNAPLPGASVAVKGTSRGTTTNSEGRYSISVPGGNATLVFSFIGYTPQEAPVGNRSIVNLTLTADVRTLQEVQVSIGYGTVARQDAVGSIAVAGRKEFGDINVQNSSQYLQGKVAGVQVVNNDGLPGSATRIVVRGTGSLTNTDPLYVIDGIQSDNGTFNAINPQDIDNITVLKDASSIAIYGAKGANGVVIVTTKRAKSGAPRVSYSGYVGFAQPWKKLSLLNASQYIDLVKDIATAQGTTLPTKLTTPDVLVDQTNWQDAVFRTGQRQEHYLNIAGGSEKTTYQASLGYTNQDATVIKNNYKRINMRFVLEEKLGNSNRVRLGQTVNFRYQVQSGTPPDFIAALRYPPYAPIYDPTNLGGYSRTTTINDLNDAFNPLTSVNLTEQRNRDFLTYAQLYGEVDIVKGLTFRSQSSFTFGSYSNYSYTSANQNGNLLNANGITEAYGYNITPLIENFLTFNKDFGSIHHLNIVAGNTYKKGAVYRNVNVAGSNFPNDDIKNVIVAPTSSIRGGSAGYDAFLSYFARVQYQLLNRYLLTASIRRDRSPAFPNNPNAYFPAVGVAWKLHEEAFLKNVPFVSELKLRASWGKAGNDNIGYFRTTTNVWKGNSNNVVYSLGPNKTYVQGSTVDAAANPNIRWEETVQTDVGLDIGLLNNKLGITLDYYNRQNNGLLTNIYIPPSAGFGSPGDQTGVLPANVGAAFNRGFETTINYGSNVGSFRYSVGVNGAYNKNQVTSLGAGGGIPIIGGAIDGGYYLTRTAPGYPIGSFYGAKVDHVAVSQAEVDRLGANYQNGLTNTALKPGDIIYRDINGDGKVDASDQTYLGSPIPKWNYGANINLGYKNWDFMLSLQGVAGVQIANGLKYWTEGTTRPFNGITTLLNRWRKDGDVTTIPRAGQDAPANLIPSDRYIENGAYTRVRNVTLGYRVPPTVLTKYSGSVVSSIRLYVTAQNLFTFTKYSGYDPEVSSVAGAGTSPTNFLFDRGVDHGGVPQPRTIIFGIQAGF